MTRTTPDPVFAAAVRAELEARAGRRAPGRAAAPAGRDLRQLAVVVAVGVLIVVTLVGIGHLGTRLAAGPPARPVPSASIASPSTAVTAPAQTPTPQRTRGTAGSLVVPDGFEHRSDAELRAWAATLPGSTGGSVWIEQQILIVHCMADQGFLFDPEWRYSHGKETVPSGQQQAYGEALSGPPSTGAYDWRTAGCTGLAVHETGQDDAH